VSLVGASVFVAGSAARADELGALPSAPRPPGQPRASLGEPLRRDFASIAATYRVTAGGSDGLDRELEKNGFPRTALATPLYGFGIDFDWHRLRFGLDISRSPTATLVRQGDGASTKTWRNLGSFGVGYDVIVRRSFSVYPVVGIAFGGVDMTFDPAKSPLVPGAFSKYVGKGNVDASSSEFATDWAVGFSGFMPFTDPHKPRGFMGTPGIVVDARLGYLWHLSDGGFRVNGHDDAPGLPGVKLEGPYARLAVGLVLEEEKYRPCSDVCSGAAHASPSCGGSTCGLSCDVGYGDCDGDLENGCERHLDTLTDCGGCGVRCELAHAAGACATNRCEVATCEPGFADCDGEPKNGCETDVHAVPGGVCPLATKKGAAGKQRK